VGERVKGAVVQDWLVPGHLLGMLLWGGGLLAIARRAHRGGEHAQPKAMTGLYRQAVMPGAFLTFFTGIWLLHQQPKLLYLWVFDAKLLGVVGLMVADALCAHRFVRNDRSDGARTLFIVIGGLLAGCILLATLLSSDSA
jgi:uncharacterized membrane protein